MRNVFMAIVLTRVSGIDCAAAEAMIVEILEHNTQQLVGRLFLSQALCVWNHPINALHKNINSTRCNQRRKNDKSWWWR